jgi:hypothetical protein
MPDWIISYNAWYRTGRFAVAHVNILLPLFFQKRINIGLSTLLNSKICQRQHNTRNSNPIVFFKLRLLHDYYIMPMCEDWPDGPCPVNRNDKTVHSTQGDLFLCDACEKFRFPVNDRRQVTKATGSRMTVDTRGSRSCSDTAAKNCPIPKKDSRSSDAIGLPLPEVSGASAAAYVSASSASSAPYLIVNELLSYVGFHRNKANADALPRTVLSFYPPTDTCQSKRISVKYSVRPSVLESIIKQLPSLLSSCSFVAERRNSTTRGREARGRDR